MTPEVERLLRDHVADILANAGIPRHARADLEEELVGHLVERWHAHAADGLEAVDAAGRAIADFGTSAELGSELGRTYHSRLWASTIGVLLPTVAPAASRPGVVGGLRFVLGLATVLTVIALAMTVPTLTPARALGTGTALVIGLTGLVLAFQALGRGQRWALTYAIAVTVILLVEGIGQIVATAGPRSIVIPLGSILAAGVLWAALNSWQQLRAFVRPSGRLNRALCLGLSISLLAPLFVPGALAAMPDPTQATADDLRLGISMTCDRGEVSIENGPTLLDVQRATLVIDSTWSHTDLLPYGLAGVLTHPDNADTSGLRALDPRPWLWSYTDEPTIVDTTTGQAAGWWGSTSPSVGLLPTDIAGSLTFAIDPGAIRPNRTIRATWFLSNAGDDQQAQWPRMEVFYAHLDRFLLAGTVACGETVLGRQVPPSGGAPAPVLNPFPF